MKPVLAMWDLLDTPPPASTMSSNPYSSGTLAGPDSNKDQCEEERRIAHCPSSPHCRIHLRPQLLVLLMVPPRQFYVKVFFHHAAHTWARKMLLTMTVSQYIEVSQIDENCVGRKFDYRKSDGSKS